MKSFLPLLVAFGAGMASFLSPCILPLILAYLAFITGISIDELKDSQEKIRNLKRIFYETLLFILGFSFIFVILGASATYLGGLISSYQKILRIIGGIIVILFGLYLTGLLKIRPLQYEKRIHLKTKPTNLFGSFLIGAVFALGWSPCVGPILASILAYAATQETLSQGVLLLSIYSLGLGLPFLITALAINTFLNFFQKIRKYFKAISIASGLLLITIGLLIIFQGGFR
ncbi:cytochrome c biogenesis protein CcdA [bacterium]|nr:cytochrome c biogenesis protein CcdA [bacterium]